MFPLCKCLLQFPSGPRKNYGWRLGNDVTIWTAYDTKRNLLTWIMNMHVLRILGPNEIYTLLTIESSNMTDDPIKEILGGPKCLEQVIVEKTNNNDNVVKTAVSRVNETQLTAATGGAELSCYRCTIPFGVVILIAGVVVTAVAYSFNSHGSIISVLGLVLLSSGLLLVCSSALCWKIRQRKKRAKRRESQTALVANQRSLFA